MLYYNSNVNETGEFSCQEWQYFQSVIAEKS